MRCFPYIHIGDGSIDKNSPLPSSSKAELRNDRRFHLSVPPSHGSRTESYCSKWPGEMRMEAEVSAVRLIARAMAIPYCHWTDGPHARTTGKTLTYGPL